MKEIFIGTLIKYCGMKCVIDHINPMNCTYGLYTISPFKNIGTIFDDSFIEILSKNDYGETEPVNNYFRGFCFWCNVETKSSVSGYYCPKCLR